MLGSYAWTKNCTPSPNSNVNYSFRITTCGSAKSYSFESGKVAMGTCTSGVIPVPGGSVNVTLPNKLYSTETEARNDCKTLLSNKCPTGSKLSTNTCNALTMVTLVPQFTYQAKDCGAYKQGVWQDQYIAQCNTIECEVETQIAYSIR